MGIKIMDTAEFRQQILDVKEIIEFFLLKTLPENTTNVENFSDAVSIFNQDLSTLHDSLLTIINYFSLQQNAINALMTIDTVIKTNQVKVQNSDVLIHTLRMVILPQIEIFVQNLFSAVKAKKKIQDHIRSQNLNHLPEIIDDLVKKDQIFLDLIEMNLGSETSLLQQSLQSMLMSRLETSRINIDKMKNNLKSVFGPNQVEEERNSDLT